MAAPTKPSAFQPSAYLKRPRFIGGSQPSGQLLHVGIVLQGRGREHPSRGWIIVGRIDEWADPGQYSSIETVGGPVLIVRDDAGTLRASRIFCRHRGALLMEGCGTARMILCPYHAWSYRLNGADIGGAVDVEETVGFDKAEYEFVADPAGDLGRFRLHQLQQQRTVVEGRHRAISPICSLRTTWMIWSSPGARTSRPSATGSSSLKTRWNP